MFSKPTNPFLQQAYKKAQKNPQIIVYPEADIHDKTLKACIQVAKSNLAYPILLGPEKSLMQKIKDYNGKIPNNLQIHDYTVDSAQKEYYKLKLLKLRKHKGLTEIQAQDKVNDLNYYGIMMLESNHAHGLISGAMSPTSTTVKPAFEVIRTKSKFHKVSGFFFMLVEDQTLLFADCAINVNPTAEELAQIGLDTALTAKKFGLIPKVAFLSFTTESDKTFPENQKVKEAAKIAQQLHPELIIEGEIQADAALVASVSRSKQKQSRINGQANVLIFPDLNSGNIAYKLVERLGKAKAIGPILQGLNMPVNDLSRGCSIQDIVDLTAITCVEAQNENYY